MATRQTELVPNTPTGAPHVTPRHESAADGTAVSIPWARRKGGGEVRGHESVNEHYLFCVWSRVRTLTTAVF